MVDDEEAERQYFIPKVTTHPYIHSEDAAPLGAADEEYWKKQMVNEKQAARRAAE